LSGRHTVTLERLGLVVWSERRLTPAENPRFARDRRRARLGSVSFANGLRRWLAGTHLAPVSDDDLLLPAADNRQVVGGIEVSYRALDLTHEGRDLIRAVSGVR
jgi:hypothetical protein